MFVVGWYVATEGTKMKGPEMRLGPICSELVIIIINYIYKMYRGLEIASRAPAALPPLVPTWLHPPIAHPRGLLPLSVVVWCGSVLLGKPHVVVVVAVVAKKEENKGARDASLASL
jgi:hypothetical protein